MLASDDKPANLKEAARWVRQAASEGARVVALPEVFIWRGNKQLERAAAEPIPGPTTAVLTALARELGIYLLGGSFFLKVRASPKAHYTTPLFLPKREVMGRHRETYHVYIKLVK